MFLHALFVHVRERAAVAGSASTLQELKAMQGRGFDGVAFALTLAFVLVATIGTVRCRRGRRGPALWLDHFGLFFGGDGNMCKLALIPLVLAAPVVEEPTWLFAPPRHRPKGQQPPGGQRQAADPWS